MPFDSNSGIGDVESYNSSPGQLRADKISLNQKIAALKQCIRVNEGMVDDPEATERLVKQRADLKVLEEKLIIQEDNARAEKVHEQRAEERRKRRGKKKHKKPATSRLGW